MNIRKAFAAAAAKFPVTGRKEALAAFVNRYSQHWPIANYRCHGADAEVIDEFLKGCGLGPEDYAMVSSAREPGSAVVRWVATGRVQQLCAALMESLQDDGARLALYKAQSAASGDPAPGLEDSRDGDSGDPASMWDPLGLAAKTEAIAKAHVAPDDGDGDVRAWAKGYLAKHWSARTPTAPLWVLERAVLPDGGLRLFRPTTRSGTGRTAGVPYAMGRYVKPDEDLVPAFPMLASLPVINLAGDAERRESSALKGYMSLNVGDLADAPSDDGRGMWLHVEDAYVDPSFARSREAVDAVTDPARLWPYVEGIFQAAYGCDAACIPGQSLVRVGGKFRNVALSTVDRSVADGSLLDVRACMVLAPKGSRDGAKARITVTTRRRGFRWADEPAERSGRPDPRRVREVEDAAAEWFAMTHAGPGSFLAAQDGHRQPARDTVSAEELRACAASTPGVDVSAAPGDLTVDADRVGGGRWSAPAHVVSGVVSEVRGMLGCEHFVDAARRWKGPDAGLHAASLVVPAMYSAVRDADAAPEQDDLFEHRSPAEVTAALGALADPARQLRQPAGVKKLLFDLVVETNLDCHDNATVKACASGNAVGDTILKNMFLHALQNNARRGWCGNWNNLAPHCDYAAHHAMYDSLVWEFGGTARWEALWGATSTGRADQSQWDVHNGRINDATTKVLALADSFGRLVLVFRTWGASAAVARASFRWSAGMPIASDAAAEALSAPGPVVNPSDPAAALLQIVAAHVAVGGLVPGWAPWATCFDPDNSGALYYTPGRDDYIALARRTALPQFRAADVL